ncbi:MAG: NAD(P)-binding domain-containing protein [Hyphomicrobiaceae bacterium]
MSAQLPSPTLSALEARVRDELARTAHPAQPWMTTRDVPDGRHVYDVVVVGAGQGGLAVAHALRRSQVTNILVIDKAPSGGEGVWVQYARMPTLRSPKEFTGPDLGLPSLTYQSWHEATYGSDSWAALGRIRKDDWSAYLGWYRRVLALPVRNEAALAAIAPLDGGGLRLAIDAPAGREELFARKVVLATGQDGTGRWSMPDFVEALPQRFRATCDRDIDFAALKGKTVAVLGQGASAADNAATALEAGAASVHMFVRRAELQRVQPYLWLTFAGFLRHIGEMPDEWRWRFMRHILTLRESFPQETYDRMCRHPSFAIHRAAGWRGAEVVGDRVRITTAKGPFDADFLICGTGIEIDLAHRPELAALAGKVATWADRYTPPAEEADPRLARFPYHASDGSFLERAPGSAPWLADIHDFTIGTTMSFGPFGCSINAMNIAVPKLVAGITRGLFAADIESHWRALRAFEGTVFEPRPIDRGS